ncbi:hypothetical protein [Arthrobacter sp. AET 35A]|uniref:hypothetical protein n=1 Tax=Arthrobacter sp. AET 35A TaxID=2292643 RepID=UPI00177E322A|nr:hypothetical protein [Arthrobacter sp. AET 35A]
MDAIPLLVSNDRLAVACALAFGSYAGGNLSFIHPISTEMASAISRLFRPAVLQPGPIDYEPRAIAYGQNTFLMAIGENSGVTPVWKGHGHTREFALQLPSMSEAFSSSFIDDRLTVPTNAHYLSSARYPDDQALLPYIAQAVLLSEDFDVGTISLPSGTVRNDTIRSVGALLASCGLKIRIPTAAQV